ncbi:MAG: zf-HC2 domain-containing protein [bacterium]
MSDCPNADVRDLLPDLVHGRLDEATRAMVELHVAGCDDCSAELALLGDLRSSMGQAPALDLGAIAAAVPAYRAPMRRSWVGWRTAAAVTLIVAGGSSIIVTQHIGSSQPGAQVPSAPVVPALPPPASANTTLPESVSSPTTASPTVPTPTRVEPSVAPRTAAPAERELAMSGGTLTDLSDTELASLLKDIESLDALPSTDVESVPIAPIAPRRGAP